MDGDDAGHCANGLTAQKFREATDEERAAYRRWLRGIIFFYCGMLFISGVAVVTYSGTGHTAADEALRAADGKVDARGLVRAIDGLLRRQVLRP